MDARTVANAYRQSSIENAPPIKIVRLLYEGALRFLDRAQASGPVRPGGEGARWLNRADAIVVELRLALDHSIEPEVTRGLESLYLFVESELGRAVSTGAGDAIDNARGVLAKLLEAWAAVELEGQPA